MITLEKDRVMNLDGAIRGARNPMNSWGKSDSGLCAKCDGNTECPLFKGECYILGENDIDLARRLCKAGSDHRKFLRQIFVTVDINAPLYWWKEFDTYKVGTTANSCSTMHKIHAKEFTLDDFSHERMTPDTKNVLSVHIIPNLEWHRRMFNLKKDKEHFNSMIQLLPSSYNQMRTVTMTYENLRNMYQARKSHKLDEWHTFCDWAKGLPYANTLILGE